MIAYQNGRPLALSFARRVRYSRKSTTKDDRQANSHEQQTTEMDLKWSPLPDSPHFRDNHTGTTFDRPAFQQLIAYCEANPCSADQPGVVEMYDPSRLGRPLTGAGQPDIMAFLMVIQRFRAAGWHVRFVTVELTGHEMVDLHIIIAHAFMAAEYSAKLKQIVARGKRDHVTLGRWIHGQAPFPATRYDDGLGRMLKDGAEARPGTHGTLLRITDEARTLWEDCARMLLAGHSLNSIGAEVFRRVGEGAQRGRWGHSRVRSMLSNRALIGELTNNYRAEDGTRHSRVILAEWAASPLVNVDLFHRVQVELERRAATPRSRRRKHRFVYPLPVHCAKCGAAFHGSTLPKKQGEPRCYTHPQPNERLAPEQYARAQAAGCKQWVVYADELEEAVKEMIIRERGSEEFEDRMRAMILSRDDYARGAREALAGARARLSSAEEGERRLLQVYARAAEGDLGLDSLVVQMGELQKEQHLARQEVTDAERLIRSTADAWATLRDAIHETRNLAAIWPSLRPLEQKRVFDHWVDALLVMVEPVPGMLRKNRKTSVVFLRTAPGLGRLLQLAMDGGRGSIEPDLDGYLLSGTCPSEELSINRSADALSCES